MLTIIIVVHGIDDDCVIVVLFVTDGGCGVKYDKY